MNYTIGVALSHSPAWHDFLNFIASRYGTVRIVTPGELRTDIDMLILFSESSYIPTGRTGNIAINLPDRDDNFRVLCNTMIELYLEAGIPVFGVCTGLTYLAELKGMPVHHTINRTIKRGSDIIINLKVEEGYGDDVFVHRNITAIDSDILKKIDRVKVIACDQYTSRIEAVLGDNWAGVSWNPMIHANKIAFTLMDELLEIPKSIPDNEYKTAIAATIKI